MPQSQAHTWLETCPDIMSRWEMVKLRIRTTESIVRIYEFPDGSVILREDTPDGKRSLTAKEWDGRA